MPEEEPNRYPSGLLWWPLEGRGFYPVPDLKKYEKSYFEKYVGYAKTPMGAALTNRRVEFTRKYSEKTPLVDIGIGSGHFIESRGAGITFGYDVNPVAIAWLLDRNLWWDPYALDPRDVCCWDSLEHIKRPEDLIKRVQRFAFISIPIFEGPEQALRSKHFRSDEHFWYFTKSGLVRWMEGHGFRLLEENSMETELGREDIGTFAFQRVLPDKGTSYARHSTSVYCSMPNRRSDSR